MKKEGEINLGWEKMRLVSFGFEKKRALVNQLIHSFAFDQKGEYRTTTNIILFHPWTYAWTYIHSMGATTTTTTTATTLVLRNLSICPKFVCAPCPAPLCCTRQKIELPTLMNKKHDSTTGYVWFIRSAEAIAAMRKPIRFHLLAISSSDKKKKSNNCKKTL